MYINNHTKNTHRIGETTGRARQAVLMLMP